jgi:hypothetical protein
LRDVAVPVKALGLKLVVANASNADEIDAAFSSLAVQRVDALVMGADAVFTQQRDQLIARWQRAMRFPSCTTYANTSRPGD